MTRQEFMDRLRRGLAGLPAESIEDIVADYEAHFAEAASAGRSEAEAAAALGDPGRLARELRNAVEVEPLVDAGPKREERRGRRGGPFQRLASMGPAGWLALALAIVLVIIIAPFIVALVGAILGFVFVLLVVVLALVGVATLVTGGRYAKGWGPWRAASPVEAKGPVTTRPFAWPGGESLRISVPAEVSYAQSATVSLTISGPSDALDHVFIVGGDIRYDRWITNAGRLKIALTAPDVTRFSVLGSADVVIKDYAHDRLKIRIAGRGVVRAAGQARAAEAAIAGKGDIDLGQLKGEAVKIDVAGSGRATIAPSEIAEIGIAGSGVVTLLTEPPVVKSRVAGSGRIIHSAASAPG